MTIIAPTLSKLKTVDILERAKRRNVQNVIEIPNVWAWLLSNVVILKPFNPKSIVRLTKIAIMERLNVGKGIPKTVSTMGTVFISPNRTQSTSISEFLALEVIKIIPIANNNV